MSHKIKTDIGYCVVSDDCALDEGELKTLAADIKKQPKLTQPNFFIDMRYDYKFIQLQALLKITELLQPMIQGNIKNKTAGIVNMDSVYVYQERNEVEIVLPLASFGVLRHYYEELRAALIAMPAIQVEYPKWSHKVRKTLYGKGPLCTYVAISRDEKNKRRELVHFSSRSRWPRAWSLPSSALQDYFSAPSKIQEYLHDQNLFTDLQVGRCRQMGRGLFHTSENTLCRK